MQNAEALLMHDDVIASGTKLTKAQLADLARVSERTACRRAGSARSSMLVARFEWLPVDDHVDVGQRCIGTMTISSVVQQSGLL